jgi:GNAT superfamily N-acetyltransferase
MQIREARIEDAEAACQVLRRSIVELCELDHKGDADVLDLWLANKTPENVRRWIREGDVFIATEDGVVLGVGAVNSSGEITLNYVSPDARFTGVSKALIGRLEARALALGASRVTLESTATARRFYRSAGYEECGAPTRSFFGITLCYPMGKQLSRG